MVAGLVGISHSVGRVEMRKLPTKSGIVAVLVGISHSAGRVEMRKLPTKRAVTPGLIGIIRLSSFRAWRCCHKIDRVVKDSLTTATDVQKYILPPPLPSPTKVMKIACW